MLNLLLREMIRKFLKVYVNIDGVPIAKSSGSQFWPIMGMIIGLFLLENFLNWHLSWS